MTTTSRRRRGMLIALAATLGIAVVGFTAGVARAAGGPPFTPGELVGTLHRVNQVEIEAGKMAERRGGTQAMKDYGATLRHDHATADERLRRYADEHHLNLDTTPPVGIGSELAQTRGELENLENLGGASFDREFAELMAWDHQKAIIMVDRARRQTRDPQLKAMLDEVEPNLREHAQIAANLLMGTVQSAAGAATRPTPKGP